MSKERFEKWFERLYDRLESKEKVACIEEWIVAAQQERFGQDDCLFLFELLKAHAYDAAEKNKNLYPEWYLPLLLRIYPDAHLQEKSARSAPELDKFRAAIVHELLEEVWELREPEPEDEEIFRFVCERMQAAVVISASTKEYDLKKRADAEVAIFENAIRKLLGINVITKEDLEPWMLKSGLPVRLQEILAHAWVRKPGGHEAFIDYIHKMHGE